MINSMIISLALAFSFQSVAMEADAYENLVEDKTDKKEEIEGSKYSDDLNNSQSTSVVSTKIKNAKSKREEKSAGDFEPPKKKLKKSVEKTESQKCTYEDCEDETESFAGLLQRLKMKYDLFCFPDPFIWWPWANLAVVPALVSPERFVEWYQKEYKRTIIAFESWKGYSFFFLRRLTLLRKSNV